MALTPDQLDENGGDVAAAGINGPALVVRSGGGRAGETFHLDREQTTVGRSPDCDIFLDDVTVSRKHAVVKQERREADDRGPGQPQRNLSQPAADRVGRPGRRGRAANREVQADVPPMSAAHAPERERLLTIGAVCERLKGEFPDISISKIRYLEGEGLVNPQRTRGGYRLFSDDDVERLEKILRLQRDEFLPLKVIREELQKPTSPERRSRRASGLRDDRGRARPALAVRAGRHRDEARPRAGGVRADHAEGRGRRALLHRDRCRDRLDLRTACELRRSPLATCARSARRPSARPACWRP